MEDNSPMTLSDFIKELLAVEKKRNQFDLDHCVVPHIVDTSKRTSDLYFGVDNTSKPLVLPLFKSYKTSNLNYGQNNQDRIQAFTLLFPELFNTANPKSANNLDLLSHNQISVRLMEVTKDPLAALSFACQHDASHTACEAGEENETEKTSSPSGAVYLLRFDEGLSHVWTNPYFKEMMNLAFEPQVLPINSIQNRYPVLFRELGNNKEEQGAWDKLSRPRLILSNGNPDFIKSKASQGGHLIFLPPLFEIVSIKGKACLEQVPLFGKTPDGIRTSDEYNRQLTTSFKVEIPSGSKSGIRTELERLADFPRAMNIPGDIDDIRK